MNQYQTTIGTEIMAGVGPDVILTDYFPDLYKTMDSGAFVNLNSIISGDPDFHMEDYNTVVMNARYYNGGQYIMPSRNKQWLCQQFSILFGLEHTL